MSNGKGAVALARTGPGFEVIAQTRRRLLSEIRLNVGAAYVWIAWVYGGVLFATITPLLSSARFLGGGPASARTANLAMFVIVVGFGCFYIWYLFRRRDAATRLKRSVLAGDLLIGEVRNILRPAGALVGFAPEQLEVRLNPHDLSATASTFSIRGKHYLCTSPAMVKVMRQNPKYARSVLIHEIAHLQQKDTNAVAITFRFVKYQFIMSLFLMPFYVSLYWGAIDQPDRISATAFFAFLEFIFTLAIFFANRNLRRLGEKAADLLVILCGEGEGLQEILQASLSNATATSFIQRLSGNHPLVIQRLKWAKEAESVISKYAADQTENTKRESLRLHALDFIKAAGLVLARGFFYAALVVLIMVLYVWIEVSLPH